MRVLSPLSRPVSSCLARMVLVFTVIAALFAAAPQAHANGSGITQVTTSTLYGPGTGMTAIPGISLYDANGLAEDASGNFYISDDKANQVVEISSTGVGTVLIARGTLIAGSALLLPQGVAVDTHGNLYIADTYNNRIVTMKTTGSGTASVVATGSSFALNTPYGIAVDATGNLYIADNNSTTKRILEVPYNATSGVAVGSNTATVSISLGSYASTIGYQIFSIALDTANNFIYVAGASQIVKLNVATSTSSLYVGYGGIPDAMLVDSAGNLYVADTGDQNANYVFKYPAGGSYASVTTATARDALYTVSLPTISALQPKNGVTGLAIDPTTGKLYTAVGSNSDYPGTPKSTIPYLAVNTAAGPLNLGSVTVGSTATQTLTFSITASGSFPFAVGSISYLSLGASNADFAALTPDTSTTLCTATSYTANVTCTLDVTFSPQSAGLRRGMVVLRSASSSLLIQVPVYGIGLQGVGNFDPGSVSTYAGANPGTGQPATAGSAGGAYTLAQFNSPLDAVMDGNSNVYVADVFNHVVRKISAGLAVSVYAGTVGTAGSPGNGVLATATTLKSPYALALDGAGNLYIADSISNVVSKVDAVTGLLTKVAGGGTSTTAPYGDGSAATSATLASPEGIAIDTAGNLYIADLNHNAIRKVTTAGLISTVAGTPGSQGSTGDGTLATAATLNGPQDVEVDSAGNLYISSVYDNSIRKVTAPTGVITRYAGTYGSGGSTGNGVSATSSGVLLNAPSTMSLDAAGNLFFADTNNNLIREVTAGGTILTVAGTRTPPTINSQLATYSGDGGPATAATFNFPFSVRVLSNGDLLIADTLNNVLRYVAREVVILPFASSVVGTVSSDSPKVETFTNGGTANITITPPTVTGTFNPGFTTTAFYLSNTSGSGACAQLSTTSSALLIAPGASCTDTFNFNPTTTGGNPGAFVVTSASSPTSAIYFSGTGTAPPITGFTISSLSGGTAGTAQGVTITAINNGSTATTFTGAVTITSTDPNATINGQTIGTGITLTFTSGMNGVMTLSGANGVVFKTAGLQTITVTVGSVSQTTTGVTVSAGAAATISALSGSGQSAVLGVAFTNAIQAQVVDAYGNPVSGNSVIFSSPSTGATAITNPSLCTTPANGKCSSTLTANGAVGNYTVTATATGVITPASFTLTNTIATPSITFTSSPTASAGAVYGQNIVLTATAAAIGSVYPTGNGTFKDGVTTLTSTATPTSGVYTYTALFPSVGPHNYTVSIAADSNFTAGSSGSAIALTVAKQTISFTVPTTQPVVFAPGVLGSLPIPLNIPYTQNNVNFLFPTGGMAYTITPAAGGSSVASGTIAFSGGGASVPIPATLTSGLYTVALSYAGDANYNAISTTNVSISIGTPSYTVAANPTSLTITRGTTGTSVITFTPVAGYAGTATLACSGLPANAACVFSTNPVVMTGNNAVLTSTLTVFTLAPHAVASSSILWIPGVLLATFLFLRRRSLTATTRSLLMLLVLASAALGMCGCGSGFSGTTTGTSTVQVNVSAVATAGSSSPNLNQSATISITIQ